MKIERKNLTSYLETEYKNYERLAVKAQRKGDYDLVEHFNGCMEAVIKVLNAVRDDEIK